MTTGEKIAALRREAGLSQEALADRLGLSRQAVSKWEADQAVPGMDNLVELAKLFGVPVDTLLRPDEPLPGKSEQQASPAMQPTADTISHQPALTKKTGWLIWGLGAMIAVSVVCSVVSLVWLLRLQEQVNNMPRGGDTIYVPAPTGESVQPDVTGAEITHTLDPDDPDRLLLRCSVLPVETQYGETAVWQITADGQTETAEAVYENGRYTGELSLPLPDGDLAIYLLLTRDGVTRSLYVETLFQVADEYRYDVNVTDSAQGHSGIGGGTSMTGQVFIEVYQRGVREQAAVYPVSGRVVLTADGAPYDSLPIDEVARRVDEWRTGQCVSLTYMAELSWRGLDVPLDKLDWYVELTDNLGRTQRYAPPGGVLPADE